MQLQPMQRQKDAEHLEDKVKREYKQVLR